MADADTVTTIAADISDKPKLHGFAAWTPEQRAEAVRKSAAKRAANRARSEAAKARAANRKTDSYRSEPTEPPKPEADDEQLFEACGYLWGRLWGAVGTMYRDERIPTSKMEDEEAAPALAVGAKALGVDKFVVKRRYEIGGTLSVGRQTTERLSYIRDDGWWPHAKIDEPEDDEPPQTGWNIPGTTQLHDASTGAPSEGIEWHGGLPGPPPMTGPPMAVEPQAVQNNGAMPGGQTGIETDLPIY